MLVLTPFVPAYCNAHRPAAEGLQHSAASAGRPASDKMLLLLQGHLKEILMFFNMLCWI
jgi:hypothetical protein